MAPQKFYVVTQNDDGNDIEPDGMEAHNFSAAATADAFAQGVGFGTDGAIKVIGVYAAGGVSQALAIARGEQRGAGRAGAREQSVREFIAEFFSGSHALDYSTDLDNCTWTDLVNLATAGGEALEDAVQRAAAQGRQVEEWYDVLEKASEAFVQLLKKHRGMPPAGELLPAYKPIIAAHAGG